MTGPATLFVTPYGRPAAALLRERLSAAKGGDPLRPVSVLVPTNYVGVSLRRLLASGDLGPVTPGGSGIAGLTLLTVYRLAELVGASTLAGGGRRPVSTPLLTAAVRRVLAEQPGIFAPVVTHPSTERALVRAYRELSELTLPALDHLGRSGNERVVDLVRIVRAARGRLADGWYDEADLMRAAAHAINGGSAVLDDLGTVIVYLPERLTVPAAALLRTLADVTSVEIVAGLTGVADADADVSGTLERLGFTESDRQPPHEPTAGGPVVTDVVSVSDAEEEVRSAVDRVLSAAGNGTPLARIAVLYPQPEPYARIVDEQLTAAGIPWNGAAVRPLADRMVGRWLLDLLDLPGIDFARAAVMGLFAGAPTVRPGTAAGDGPRAGARLPTAAWERISRDAGVVRGRAEWSQRLHRYARAHEQRAARRESGTGDDTDGVAAVERDRAAARRATDLAATVADLIGELDRARRIDSWDGLAAWCRRMISRWITRRRDDWPQSERDAADRVDAVLDRLAALRAVEPSTDLATFRRALAAELEDDLGRVGALGRGVLVGTSAHAFGVDLDVVIVLGMAEGLTPVRPREDSLLPDAARAAVDELDGRDQRTGTQHRHLLAALAGARDQRVLVFPRGDLRRSAEHAESRWLLDAADTLHGQRALPRRAPWLDEVASFADRVRTTRAPATARQHRLRSLAWHGSAALGQHPLVAGDAHLRNAVAMIADRSTGRFGPFTGRLGAEASKMAAAQVHDQIASATALEQWLACPHAYLLRHVLKVHPVDNPEELLQISALEQGDVVHRVLDAWLRAQIDAGLPRPDDPWPPAAIAELRQLTDDALHDAMQRGVTGHALMWSRDRPRIAAELDAFVGRDDERRRSARLTPLATEVPFGEDGRSPLHVDLGGGRVVRVRGRIDRLDVADDGTIVVADYKTGTSEYTTVTADDPLDGYSKLQLPLYALAVAQMHPDTPVYSEFWFATTRGRNRRRGYLVTDDVVAQLRAALDLIVSGIDQGLFPRRPPDKPSFGSYVQCAYCDPDGLGTAHLYRAWERIRQDPALHPYVGAVEPGVVLDRDEYGDRQTGSDQGGGLGAGDGGGGSDGDHGGADPGADHGGGLVAGHSERGATHQPEQPSLFEVSP